MSHSHEYPDGAPCWVDLSTPDLDGARRFYAGLLGWTFDASQPEMGHYTTCRRDGKTVAGMAPKQPGMDMPAVWSVYLMTRDADALAAKITESGGTVLVPPMQIPGQGRMMFATDPTGASFGAWEPDHHRGAELHEQPGSMCWHEVNTPDGAAADAFYRRLFDYEQSQVGDGKTFDYTVWSLAGAPVCGRMQMDATWEGLPPHWMTYFAVEQIEAAVARVGEFGGKVMHGPIDSPHGKLAVVADPYGSLFSIIERRDPSA